MGHSSSYSSLAGHQVHNNSLSPCSLMQNESIHQTDLSMGMKLKSHYPLSL
jgi:hypothetical protein